MRIWNSIVKKAKTITLKQAVVNTVILVLLLATFVYVTVQLTQGISTRVSTQRTQKVTESQYVFLEGHVFKNETLIKHNADVVYYTVGDGEKVGVNQVYAELYTETSLSEEQRRTTENRLYELSLSISILEKGLSGNLDPNVIKDELSDAYYSYTNHLQSGDIQSAVGSGNSLLASLIDYFAVTGGEKSAKDTLDALKAERDSLLASIGGKKTQLISETSFTFYHSADGYEGDSKSEVRLNSIDPTNLTIDELDARISSKPTSTKGVIGKAAHTAKWYFAVPLDNATHETLKKAFASNGTLEGVTMPVTLQGSTEKTVKMLVEGVLEDEIDPNRAYLLLSSFDTGVSAGLDRDQSIKIEIDRHTGYRVPTEAIHNVKGSYGEVYVLVGSVVELRRVTIIIHGDGYCIVYTNEKDTEEGIGGELPYLKENDMIVTSGNDLYDGKLLD